MSLSRGSFLRALIGAPFAAKAVERMIANGAPKPVPVKPTVQPPYERVTKGALDLSRYQASGTFYYSGDVCAFLYAGLRPDPRQVDVCQRLTL